MDTIKISVKEYREILKIVYCTETFLNTNNSLTKIRLIEYINEFNQTNK